jgi:hypothetical protein
MVEFTIALPIVLFMILAVAEVGRALIRYNALTKAVRDGARYAASEALLGTTGAVVLDAGLENEIRNLVVYGNPEGNGTAILQGLEPDQIAVSSPGAGQIRVTASYPYQPLIGPGLPTLGLGSTTSLAFDMQAAVSMRAL